MKTLLLAATLLTPLAHAQQTTWRFDNLTHIGTAHITTVGMPTVVDTPLGKAIHFNGTATSGDALFFDQSPLAAATAYTFEVIFRPSSKGVPAQRFFHTQETGSAARRMFELRIIDNQWCLDAVAIDAPAGAGPQDGATAHRVIILSCDAAHMHPLDQWYAVAATWDGHTLRSYVNSQPQGEATGTLTPLGPGTTSAGTRIDKRDFFTGDIFSARFTPKVLPTSEFVVPATKP